VCSAKKRFAFVVEQKISVFLATPYVHVFQFFEPNQKQTCKLSKFTSKKGMA
jgi:hypothetical protein